MLVVTYLQAAGEGEGEQQRRVPRGARAHGVSEARGARGALAGALAACRAPPHCTALSALCTLSALSTLSTGTVAGRVLSRGVALNITEETCARRGASAWTARPAGAAALPPRLSRHCATDALRWPITFHDCNAI
ncbi:unnamed protein product, partial [Brenthis ino]